MKIRFSVCTTVGRFRKENQDNYYLNGITKPISIQDISLEGTSEEENQVFAVCDGMGGEEAGEVASFLAVEMLKSYPAETFKEEYVEYLLDVNETISNFQKQNKCITGTTFAGLYFFDGMYRAVNVGDSRVYLIKNGEITRLSKDHTEFQELVNAGYMKPEDYSKTDTHNYLTQSLGMDLDEISLEPYLTDILKIEPGTNFLLCSDGLYGVLSEDELMTGVLKNEKISLRCQKLVDLAEHKGSKDNITAMIVSVEE